MTDPVPDVPRRRRRAEVVEAPKPGDPWKLAPEGTTPAVPLPSGTEVPVQPEEAPVRRGRRVREPETRDVPSGPQVEDELRAAHPGRTAALATSAQLAREIDTSVREAGIVASAQQVRGDSHPFGELPKAGPGYERITERVFDLADPDAEYLQLEADLAFGAAPGTGDLLGALDGAEDNARRAHRLYVNARVDAEAFNIDADVVEAAMRTQAIAALQHEKDSGHRSKAITDADTTAKMSAMFPDEYRDLAVRKVKSRKMIEHLETFANLWRSRCYSLSKMLESKR